MDRGRDEGNAAPYQPEELESAWEALQQLTEQGVGIAALEGFEESLDPDARARLYPFAPSHLLLRREFDELFDTTPDLTGADLDISRFIRTGDERDLQVFWLVIEKDKKGEKPKRPSEDRQPQRKELCSVPFLKARDWLCDKDKSKLKASKRAWVWDWLDGEWKPATRETLYPGRVVCVATDSGGYTIERGFSPDSTRGVLPLAIVLPSATEAAIEKDDQQQDSEQLSFTDWKTIACHTLEVAEAAKAIAAAIGLSAELQSVVELAARFHDWGKSHPAFQNMLRRKRNVAEQFKSVLLAKSKQVKPSIRARYFAGEDETTSAADTATNSPALSGCSPSFKPTHPNIRRCLDPGRKC